MQEWVLVGEGNAHAVLSEAQGKKLWVLAVTKARAENQPDWPELWPDPSLPSILGWSGRRLTSAFGESHTVQRPAANTV
ncbi:hypothetical protein WJX73_005414 [Symbiochloris irregularis]|uniref:Uncharacterized protein n=1 Tax=Symbiochloris irregularis TaxID=706552 RepID=A0AAW1PW19_9CHLO